MKLKPAATVYAIGISAIGAVVGILCSIEYVRMIIASDNLGAELAQLFVLFVLAYLCRCLPIYIRPDFAIDMAFISNFAILLCKGPIVAAAITLITTPFVVSQIPGPDKKLSHIFNTPFIKTAFNSANLTLSVYFGGTVFLQTGGVVGSLSLPGVIAPSVMLIITIITVNSTLLILLFKLNEGIPFFASFAKNFVDFLPSVIAAAPIGYFIAKFMLMSDGVYLVILFFLPLLLARFSFSMYINVKQNYYTMMKTLTNTLEAKDEYTRGHSERVEVYSKIIATEMHLPAPRIEELSVAALLHDVGKIGIDENILKKPDRLNSEERRIIQSHPEISVHILRDVKLSPLTLNIILHHHERYDGFGYPDGLGGDELPMEVYAICVADTYDAITSDRPYSHGRSPEAARDIIIEESGHQFHPEAVEAFIRAFKKGKLDIGRKRNSLPQPLSLSRPGVEQSRTANIS
jgi:putative nucleotidyltransferase with HDIG domain